MRVPAKVEPGQPVSAAAFNLLIEAVASARVEAGPGLAIDAAAGRTILSLAGGLLSRAVEAIITGVQGAEGDLVEDVTYTAQGIGKTGAVLSAVTPRYGRIFAAGVACVPARIGDTCLIIRGIDDSDLTADLFILSERYLARRCEDGGGDQSALQRPRPRRADGTFMDEAPDPGTPGAGGSAPTVGGGAGGGDSRGSE